MIVYCHNSEGESLDFKNLCLGTHSKKIAYDNITSSKDFTTYHKHKNEVTDTGIYTKKCVLNLSDRQINDDERCYTRYVPSNELNSLNPKLACGECSSTENENKTSIIIIAADKCRAPTIMYTTKYRQK